MKILFFIERLGAGGKERQLIELLKGIIKHNNIQINVIVFEKRIEYHKFYELKINHYLLSRNYFNSIFHLIRICRNIKPDIIHSWGKICTFCSIPASNLLNIKLIDGSIRYAAPVKFVLNKWIMSEINFLFSNFVVANSYAGLKTINRKSNKKFSVIYNGFDIINRMKNLKSVEYIRKQFDINTKYVIGMVARFVSAKDYNTFIEAANLILSKRTDVTFLCVGNGDKLEQIIKKVPFENRRFIKFPGKQTYVVSIIRIFDIGILACNTNGHAEGISNSIMEYMAMRKPVIATDSGGNKEIVIDNQTGFIIPPFKPNILANKINVLLSDPKLRNRMGKAGRKRIEAEFSITKMTNSFISLYKHLLNR